MKMGVVVMFKKNIILSIVIVCLIAFGTATYAQETAVDYSEIVEYDAEAVNAILTSTDVFQLKAKGSILIENATGNILIEDKSHERLAIASITKIMSMLLIMEAIDEGKISFEDEVVVSEHSYSMGGSQVYLAPGERFTVRELFKAVAIHSANDATVALGEKVAGSEDIFVSMMNEKAAELGMVDTNFLDCTGLTDEGHYSSAYDVSIMARELILKHPKIFEFTSVWHDTFRNGEFSLDNTNKLIRYYEGTKGLKTGFTNAAAHCLCAVTERNGFTLISVVLGEPNSNTRFAETRKLLDYGFANFETTKVNSKGEIIKTVSVKKGLKMEVYAVYMSDTSLLIKKGNKDKIEKTVSVEDVIEAPVDKGQKIGEVIYKIDGEQIGKADVVADAAVERASFFKLFAKMITEWFCIGRK
jgi:serine-type D-Ala-D-Ala carboxypeptidase (penicillin-binding protein 5/6)